MSRYASPYTPEQIHGQWLDWLSEMSRFIKYDVSLYRMKNVYERHLENPRTFPNEMIGNLDLIYTHIYEYDGGVIGRDGYERIIEDTMESDNEEKKFETITTILSEKGIRVGIYYKRIDFSPSFYILSTFDEDRKYYSKCDHNMYDSIEYNLYYSIRYGISTDTYYILSGMSSWSCIDIDIDRPSPDIDLIDQERHHIECAEGIDKEEISKEIKELSKKGYKDFKRIALFQYKLSDEEINKLLNE